CGDTEESSKVNPAKPSISTKAVAEVTVGGKVKDSATLTGVVDGVASEGSIDRKRVVEGKSEERPGCESRVDKGGAESRCSWTEHKLDSIGQKSGCDFDRGDENRDLKLTSCGDTEESSKVNPAKPSISTKAVAEVTVGGKVKDSATLTGVVDGVASEGS